MQKLTCFIRVDANARLGSGHIMRCLSLAAALSEQGVACTFVTADHSADGLLAGKAIDQVVLDSQWNDLTQELPRMEALLYREKPDILVVDHYYVTKDYLQILRQYTKIVYIDDLLAFPYPCDVLVNYNIYGLDWEEQYRQNLPGTKLLLGPKYAPLRKEFQNLPLRPVHNRVSDVLISTGGSDPDNIAGQLLEAIAHNQLWDSITFHFVVGGLNPNRESLLHRAAALTNIQIHCNVRKMSQLMCSCDLAVAAAGSTLYELCACGVPTVTYILADNQIPGANAFARRNLLKLAGDFRNNPEFLSHVTAALNVLIMSSEERLHMAQAMLRLTDGSGARLLAEAIVSSI